MAATANDLSNENLPALFWDALPENPESHPDYAGLLAVDDDSTPDERAHTLKEQGNSKLKMGIRSGNKVLLREAIQFYSKGLDAGATDASLISVLYANRAQVEIMLGNWRKALADSRDAVRVNPENVKAYFRGAKAALQLEELPAADKLCFDGLGVDATSRELVELQQTIRLKQEAARKLAVQEEMQLTNRMEPARKLATTISLAGYRMTHAQFRAGHLKPYVDSEGALHWPVLLVYAENMQQDVIEDFDVTTSFALHLDVMFDAEAPPLEWDQKGEYTRSNVELYYLSNAGRPIPQDEVVAALVGGDSTDSAPEPVAPSRYGKKATKWVKVNESHTLHEVLTTPDFLIPGIPVFFVVAKGTEYRDRFLNS